MQTYYKAAYCNLYAAMLEATYGDPSRGSKISEIFKEWYYQFHTHKEFPGLSGFLNPASWALVCHSIHYTRPGQSAARGPHMARKLLLSGPRTVLNIKTIYSFLSKVDQLLIFNIPQKTSLVFVKINKFKIKKIITVSFYASIEMSFLNTKDLC